MEVQSVILKEKTSFWILVLQDIRLVKDYFKNFFSIFDFYIIYTDKTSQRNRNIYKLTC